jgi:adenine phosphoribosyltransferase
MVAAIALLQKIGAVVPAAAALIELAFLNGRSRVPVPVDTLMAYDE